MLGIGRSKVYELIGAGELEMARVGELAIADAVVLLGLSGRHVFRQLDRLWVDGVASLARRRRGRPSSRRLPDELRTAAMALVRAQYHDFGLTLPPKSWPGCTTSTSRGRGGAS